MSKISELTNKATPATTDELAIVDNAGTPSTKKATLGSLPVSTAQAAALTAHNTDDEAHGQTAVGRAVVTAETQADARAAIDAASQEDLDTKAPVMEPVFGGPVRGNADGNPVSSPTWSIDASGDASFEDVHVTNLVATGDVIADGQFFGNGSGLTDLPWSQLTGTPTTLSGYGITDAVPSSRTLTAGTGIATIGNLSANRTIALSTAAQASLAKADTALQPDGDGSGLTGLTPAQTGSDPAGAAGAVQDNLTDHVDTPTGAHAASAVSVEPVGGIVETNAQGALAGIEDRKATKNGEGRNWIEVDVSEDDTVTNGVNLLAAYAAAKSLAPNGAALSANNKAWVIRPPGVYDLDGTSLVIDSPYVGVVEIVPGSTETLGTVTVTDPDAVVQGFGAVDQNAPTISWNRLPGAEGGWDSNSDTLGVLKWINGDGGEILTLTSHGQAHGIGKDITIEFPDESGVIALENGSVAFLSYNDWEASLIWDEEWQTPERLAAPYGFVLGKQIITQPGTRSGAGAIDPTQGLTLLTTTGDSQALTLANYTTQGTSDYSGGVELTIMHVTDGGSAVLTPTTKTGFASITFANVGDTVSLLWIVGKGWMIKSHYGATITP